MNLKLTAMSVLTVPTPFVFQHVDAESFALIWKVEIWGSTCYSFLVSGYLIIVLLKCSPNIPGFIIFKFHSLENESVIFFNS